MVIYVEKMPKFGRVTFDKLVAIVTQLMPKSSKLMQKVADRFVLKVTKRCGHSSKGFSYRGKKPEGGGFLPPGMDRVNGHNDVTMTS